MLEIDKKQFALLFVFSMIGIALNLAVLYSVNLAVSEKSVLGLKFAIFFFSMLVYSWLFNLMFQKKIIRLSNEFIYKNEIHLCKKVMHSRLIDFEKTGKERFYGVMEDLRSLVFIPYVFTNGLNSFIIVIVGAFYLFAISQKAAILFLFSALILISIYLLINKVVIHWSHQSRELNDYYFKIIRDVIDGFKELKLSKKKRMNLAEQFLSKNRMSAKEKEIDISNFFLITNMMGNYSFLLIVGIIAFILPVFNLLQQDKVASFIVVLLFISGSLNTLFSLQNFAARIYVAHKRIKNFKRDLDAYEDEAECKIITKDSFENIIFDQVEFDYPEDDFSLNEINLKINRGEIIFVIGGNGSGKSTFINLLTNLYNPSKGTILLNGNPIGNVNQNYRELMSVIFTDNYLFSENYDGYNLKNNDELNSLVYEMKLDKIIAENDDFIKKKFSKGQSKRIAMILSLLDNKPLLILDEWAADQDPYFRKHFYEIILPKLKTEGKTIIAVTHDDTYFQCADKIIKFDYGKIVKNISVNKNSQDKEAIWN